MRSARKQRAPRMEVVAVDSAGARAAIVNAALTAAHEAELAALEQQYAANLSLLMASHNEQVEAVRKRSTAELVQIVAQYERGRALSVARVQLARERVRREQQGRDRQVAKA